MRRPAIFLILIAAFCSLGAQHRTTNFFIHAPTAQIAQQVGQYAEHYRREKAQQWLGREMPAWPQPCPLHVNVNTEGPSGATSFHFGPSGVMGMKTEIQGPLDRLLASVLPHEITHTVFAHHFRQPVPRWADEGGSVLSEDDLERQRHDKLTRQILNRGQQIPLRRLFSLKEYPREVMCLYAQGFSMCDYLVKRSDRRTFLAFVGHGMHQGWDSAVQSFYGARNVEDLEAAWLQFLRDNKLPSTQPAVQAAQVQPRSQNQMASRPIVRTTAPPVQPLDPAPIVRGAAPAPDQVGQRFGQNSSVVQPAGEQRFEPSYPAPRRPATRGFGPTYPPPPPPVPAGFSRGQPNTIWHPATVAPIPAATSAPRVQLLPPQFDNPPMGPGFPQQ